MTKDENSFHRYTRSYLKDHPEEKATIVNEHIQRLALGKNKWNEWADEFKEYINKEEINDAVIDLRKLKNVGGNFSEAQFSVGAYFNKAQFSSGAYFQDVQFSGGTLFSKAFIVFDEANNNEEDTDA